MNTINKLNIGSNSYEIVDTWRPVSDSVSSTSSTDAASSKAVKTAYDLAASKTSNTGTVTSITAGTGLTGGSITTTGTIALATSGVTAGTYNSVTVDTYGRVTSGSTTNYSYNDIDYSVNAVSNSSGTVSLAGTTPVHVVTTTANITSLTLSSAPSDGHSCHIILTASAEKTVSIPATFTTVSSKTVVYPEGPGPIDLTIPAGGYVEVDFLTCGSKVFIRAI